MKTRFKYGLLAAAIFYSLPGMASTTSSEGGAFTVKMAKSSTEMISRDARHWKPR